MAAKVSKSTSGLVLTPRIADGLWRQELSWIVLTEDISSLYNAEVYICDSTQVYGKAKLSPPEKITLGEFKKYTDMHGIRYEDRNKWWPHKSIFHAYTFDWSEIYSEPLPAAITGDSYVREVELREETEDALKMTDDPSSMPDRELIFNHALLHRFFEKKKEGTLKGWSIEEIFKMHKRVLENMDTRNLKHTPRDRLDRITVPKMAESAYKMDDEELLQTFWISSGVIR